MDNCVEINKDIYLKFLEYKPIDYNIQRLLNSNGENADLINDQNEIDAHVIEIAFNSFQQNHLFFLNGLLLGLYRIAALASVLYAFANWQNSKI